MPRVKSTVLCADLILSVLNTVIDVKASENQEKVTEKECGDSFVQFSISHEPEAGLRHIS